MYSTTFTGNLMADAAKIEPVMDKINTVATPGTEGARIIGEALACVVIGLSAAADGRTERAIKALHDAAEVYGFKVSYTKETA